MNKSFKWRPVLWRWHRRIGLVSAILVIVVSVTGIQLNHIDSLAWDKKPLLFEPLLALYGIEKPEITAYSLDNFWLSQLNQQLYINENELGNCSGSLVGVQNWQGLIIAACSNELILLTIEGEMIERIGSVYDLPPAIDGIGVCGDALCIRAQKALYSADIEQLRWTLLPDSDIQIMPAKTIPEAIAEPLLLQHLSGGITWERLVLDIHSGRLFGLGPWLMDIVALLLIMLACSGVWLWAGGRNRKRRKRRN